jgi:membrane protein required for colicin V production
MGLLDFFILIPIGYFAWKGFMSGFVREILSIAGIILAVFLTFEYMHAISFLFKPFFSNADHATIASGIFIFIITIAAVQFIAYATQKFLELIKINFINRIAGLLFGSLKSGIVISAILLLMAGFNLPTENSRENSISYPIVIYLAPAVFNMVAAIYPGAENFVNTIEKAIEENNPIKSLPIFEQLES